MENPKTPSPWMTPVDLMTAGRVFQSSDLDELSEALTDGIPARNRAGSGVVVQVVTHPAGGHFPDRAA